MSRSYVDDHKLGEAFLANRMQRLVDLIVQQGDDMLASAGIAMPSRCVSSLLLIKEQGNVSAADIAARLCLPHQLVTQRLDLLVKLGLVRREADPQDARKKNVVLTDYGHEQCTILADQLEKSNDALRRLQQEVGMDISPIILKMIQALERVPLEERFQ